MKRAFLVLPSALVALAIVTLSPPVRAKQAPRHFDLVETTIPAVQQALDDHVITAAQLVHMYQRRIDAYNGTTTAAHLNAYIHLNQHALNSADNSDQNGDRERGEGRRHGALAGIPMILKDNIDTHDMPTTAGSVAFDGSVPLTDAFVAKKLREAGAIILGKATMTEFANFLTNGMPAGYSSLGGYGFNPYDPRPDPRTALDSLLRPFDDGRPALTPGGSSSGPGIAVAANLAEVGIGTETSGSILSPGTANGVVGIKPTVGLVSRDGIIPIAADQDTAGPLARTVRDAAIVLGVIAGFDPNDPATAACLTPGNCWSDYTQFLDANALHGARIVVPPFPANRADVMNNAIAVLRAKGAFVDVRTVGLDAAARRLSVATSCGELSAGGRSSSAGPSVFDGVELRVQARSQQVHPRPREAVVPHSVTRGCRELQRRTRAGRHEVRSGSRRVLPAVRSVAHERGYAALQPGSRGRSHPFAGSDCGVSEWAGRDRQGRRTTSTRCSSPATAAPVRPPKPVTRASSCRAARSRTWSAHRSPTDSMRRTALPASHFQAAHSASRG